MWRTDSLENPWCWERLKAGGEGDDRGWDGWMASLTQGTQVWVSSRRWWRTGNPGVLQSMGSQRVRRDWATEQQQQQYFHLQQTRLAGQVGSKEIVNEKLLRWFCIWNLVHLLSYLSLKEREAWHVAIHGVAKSWTWLSNWTKYIKFNKSLDRI